MWKKDREEAPKILKNKEAKATSSASAEKVEEVETEPKKEEKEVKKEDLLEELRQELKKAEENNLYLSAELQNFRKRMEKEKAEFFKYGHEDFVRSLLFVQDNFERALSHANSAQTKDAASQVAQILEGLEMIMGQFSETLKEQGVRSIEALGKMFDPNLHEAVAEEGAKDKKPGTIILEHLKGYFLHDRVLRASKVTVVKENVASE